MKILIMGLPGSGKTTLARHLFTNIKKKATIQWFNADTVREIFNDWDFSEQGRINQAKRMKVLAEDSGTDYVICDFVAPTEEIRKIFDADLTIWLNTIDEGRFEDTNKVFEKPSHVDIEIDHFLNNTEMKGLLDDVVTR